MTSAAHNDVKIHRAFQGDLPYFRMIQRSNYIDMIEKYLYLKFNSYGAMARIQINIIINSCVCLVYSAQNLTFYQLKFWNKIHMSTHKCLSIVSNFKSQTEAIFFLILQL